MPAERRTAQLLDPELASELAAGLTVGDVEYLVRQVRTRRRKDEKRPGNPPPGGRDVQAFKIERARDLEARLLRAIGGELGCPADTRATGG
jgi:Rod binding domain-containing protein